MVDLPLAKLSETATTITLGWTPPAGARGYVFTANGKMSHTMDGTRSSVKFAKPGPYSVEALGLIAAGSYPPPVVPPPVGQAVLGICPNVGFPTNYPYGASLNMKSIRSDTITQAGIDWAATHGADYLGLGNPINMALIDKWPQIQYWEYDNEPYFNRTADPAGGNGIRGQTISQYAVTMRDFGQAFKAKYPGKTLIFPCYVQSDFGDWNGPQGWKPWVTYLFDAAPDLGNYFDGWACHPYSAPRNAPPLNPNVDKVRGQLVARGFTKGCWVTEVGWSVGTGTGQNNEQCTEAQQAQYVGQVIDQLRSRPWVARIYIYCLGTWGTGFEQSFGMFNQNGSERLSAVAFRDRV